MHSHSFFFLPESSVVGMIYIVVVDKFCKILKALNKHLQEVARTQESSVNDQENLGLCNLVCVCEGSRVGDEEGLCGK